MPVINCVCGHRLDCDPSALFDALRAHNDAAHADLAVTDDQIRKMLDAYARMTPWDGRIVPLVGPPNIRALTPALADDLLRFFDHDAFVDNPDWSSCYCMFPHCTAPQWDVEPERTAQRNRADKAALIRRGEAHGHLAYDSGRVVGWCHAAARSSLPGVETGEAFVIDDDPSRIGSIVCFIVAPAYRRQGIARRLLDAACDGLRAQGMAIAEAYPHDADRSDARAFFGPLEMYLGAGFSVYRDNGRNTIVRKPL